MATERKRENGQEPQSNELSGRNTCEDGEKKIELGITNGQRCHTAGTSINTFTEIEISD